MKILFVHNVYKPYYRGGAETVALNVVAGLKADGHEVVVVSLGYENKIENIDDVKVHRVKPCNVFNYLDINSKPFWLRCLFHLIDMWSDIGPWQVKKIAQAEKPDFIFLQGIKGFGYVLPRLLQFYGFKTCLRVFDMQYIFPAGLLIKKPLKALDKIYIFFTKLLLGNVPLVIFPSDYVKNIYIKYGFFYNSKIEVINNPLPPQADNFSYEKSPSKPINILYLGQVEKYKGLGVLIEALQAVSGDFALHVVGDGNDLVDFKRKNVNDKRITFYGRLDPERMNSEIWPKIDLLINPSLVEETFGIVLIEAYAHGVPVIASDIGAMPSLVNEGKTGWLIFPGDTAQLRYKLERIISGQTDLVPLRAKCYEEAKKYSVKNYLAKFYDAIGYEK